MTDQDEINKKYLRRPDSSDCHKVVFVILTIFAMIFSATKQYNILIEIALRSVVENV